MGYVVEVGEGVTVHRVGDRVGIGWIYSSDGSHNENFCVFVRVKTNQEFALGLGADRTEFTKDSLLKTVMLS